jgi:hypothetical protein
VGLQSCKWRDHPLSPTPIPILMPCLVHSVEENTFALDYIVSQADRAAAGELLAAGTNMDTNEEDDSEEGDDDEGEWQGIAEVAA